MTGRRLAPLAALLGGLALPAAAQPPSRPPAQPPIPVADSARASRPSTEPTPAPGVSARSPLARQAAADSARRSAQDTLRPRTRADSVAADSAARADSVAQVQELVQWADGDSVLAALLARRGYAITRYQGERAVFLADSQAIQLSGAPAAVQQGGAVAVGANIVFNDSTNQLVVRGDSGQVIVLRDPSYGEDVIAEGEIRYDLTTRRGIVTNVSTKVVSGEAWYVSAQRAAINSARGPNDAVRFYGHDGEITSCDLTVPHYHFEARNLKVVRGSIMVARPAVLYIGNVPVVWLPFIFQDMREGRRSGLLSPRFGVAELIRNSPGYRRSVDNFGYYFAISDYMDASVWLDWRSSARQTDFDPGFLRYNGELQYTWTNRFLAGQLAAGYETYGDGRRNLTLRWGHTQQFSSRTSFRADVNYAQSTQLQRLTAIVPQAALATIASRLNYQTRRGPFSLNLGASQTQYTGQEKVDRTLPSLNINSEPISVGDWLTWTPALTVSNAQQLDYPLPSALGVRPRLDPATGRVVTDTARFDRRLTNATFNTPLEIFGFSLQNTITVIDEETDAPVRATIYRSRAPGDSAVRTFAREFRTAVNWNPSFGLPGILGGTWNITPSVSFENVAGGNFLVRSFLTGGDFVAQTKRPTFGVSATPTVYRLFGGFGPFEALRHSITPGLSFRYAPAADVSDRFLQAIGQNPGSFVGGLMQSSVGLSLSTVIEAKLRNARDSTPPGGAGAGAAADKLRLLALDFSSLSYDFVRADTLGRGLTSEALQIGARSDLLPGLNVNVGYSLFNGPSTDTLSTFRPFLTDVNASFSLSRESNILVLLNRIFGRAIPDRDATADRLEPTADDTLATRLGSIPVAGSRARTPMRAMLPGDGWQATFNYSLSRTRPDLLGTVVDYDPTTSCEAFRANPVQFDRCVELVLLDPPASPEVSSVGGVIVRSPARSSLSSSLQFPLTVNWAAGWTTSYDFQRAQFASHQVSLQRDLHDWRATFAFTQAPNGNFAFTFFIALKAQQDIKFDFNRQSYRGGAAR